MRLSPSELFAMTFAEFSAAYQGWQRQREVDERNAMDRTRWLAAAIIGPWMKHNKPLEELFPMPWDDCHELVSEGDLSIEERKARVAEILGENI